MIRLLLLGVLGAYVWLQVHGLRCWDGQWRTYARLVLAGVIGYVAFVAIGLANDPTSHNLWPFELILLVLGALAALAAIAVARRLAVRRGSG